eukprot:scaffold20946_cov64-Phaeocystis_antarctica.AAC.2
MASTVLRAAATAARKAAARRSPRRLPRARALTHPTGPTGQQDMIVPLTSALVIAAAKAKAPASDWIGRSAQDTTTPRTTAAPAGPRRRRPRRPRRPCRATKRVPALATSRLGCAVRRAGTPR